MRRFLLLTGAVLMAATAAPLAAAGDGPPDAGKALAGAIQAYRDGDCPKATSLIDQVIAAPGSTTDKNLSFAYDLAIDCAWQAKDRAKAGGYAKRAIAVDRGSDFAWRIAVAVDFDAKRYGAGLDTIDRMLAAGRGGTLNSFDPRFFLQIHVQLDRDDDTADDMRLLAIVANRAYDPDDLSAKINGTGDYLRALYARKLLTAGKRDEARALIAEFEGYDALEEIAFAPEVPALRGAPIDFRAVVEADLARHRAMATDYPHALAAINAMARDLHRLGRDDEAIVLLKAAQPRIGTPDALDDVADNLPWFWNELAYAFGATGKYDEMVDAFTKGAQFKEGSAPNVSQVINLAERQVAFSRAKDALGTLDRLGASPDASPYGLMLVHGTRGCAYAILGQLDKARAELAYAVAHEKDNAGTVTSLDLCVGDEDAAAASYVRRLASADDRRSAMLDLADYDASDPRAPKSAVAARFDRVRKRPEVVAAIRAAGGPVRIHLRTDPS